MSTENTHEEMLQEDKPHEEVLEETTTEEEVPVVEEKEEEAAAAAEEVEKPVLSAEQQAQADAVEEIAKWEASMKYKAYDKEYEMPDWVKDHLKDEETEKQFQALFAKGHGFEELKVNRNELREEVKTLKDERVQLDSSLKAISDYVQKDDMQSFFEALQIPKDKVLRYAIKELQYQELAPEQRAKVDAERQQQRDMTQWQQQNQMQQQNMEQMLVQQRNRELDLVLSDPTVTQAVQAFDTRINKPGAFREEVVNRAVMHLQQTGQDISAKDIVDQMVNMFGVGNGQATTNAAPSQSMETTPQRTAPSKKPVISNVQGTGTSPAKKVPTSIDDIRNIRDKMLANN